MQLSDQPTQRNFIFVGGPGRSGTSFVADRLGRHDDICCFPNVELKLLTEKNGLIDLYHALSQSYSPNRATVAVQQFSRFFEALVDGRFGQRPLNEFAKNDQWLALLQCFLQALSRDGQAMPTAQGDFHQAARNLMLSIADIAAGSEQEDLTPKMFLEKTPHSLLSSEFLRDVVPESRLLHVMRDPRSIAFSLRSMNWGPDTLAGCCTWVENYCAAWVQAQSLPVMHGPHLVCVQIEAIAEAPKETCETIFRSLSLPTSSDLFSGADIKTLNGWLDRCSADDLKTLNSMLGDWVRFFGYSIDRVGEIIDRNQAA